MAQTTSPNTNQNLVNQKPVAKPAPVTVVGVKPKEPVATATDIKRTGGQLLPNPAAAALTNPAAGGQALLPTPTVFMLPPLTAPFTSSVNRPYLVPRPMVYPYPSMPSPPFYYPQQQQQPMLMEQSAFYNQMQLYALNRPPLGPVGITSIDQRQRNYTGDTYFYDTWRAQQGTKQTAVARSINELHLIPLQRVVVTQVTDGTAPPSTSTSSNQPTALQPNYFDVPRIRLSPDQDSYLSAIAVAYNLLTGLVPMDPSLTEACRPFDIDEDTIAVTETQLETFLYNITEKQQNNVKPMLFVFPLFDRYCSIALRVFIFGEITADPITGFKRSLNTIDPWSWRHALPVGDNSFRKKGETLQLNSDEYKLRKQYHDFLVKFYSMILRSIMRLRVEQTALLTPDYNRFIENTLAALRPSAQSVAVLEARIRALVTRLQLLHGVMFNTAQFYSAAEALKNIIHPVILQVIARYLYFTA